MPAAESSRRPLRGGSGGAQGAQAKRRYSRCGLKPKGLGNGAARSAMQRPHEHGNCPWHNGQNRVGTRVSGGGAPERPRTDEHSSDRHPVLADCQSSIFSENRPTLRDRDRASGTGSRHAGIRPAAWQRSAELARYHTLRQYCSERATTFGARATRCCNAFASRCKGHDAWPSIACSKIKRSNRKRSR